MAESDYRPKPDDVAAVLASRTFTKGTVVGSDNNLAGTFNENTRPTAAQVEPLISQAMTEVAPGVVDNSSTTKATYGLAKTAVARRAAMLVMVSFFEEDLEDASSSWDELEKLYKDALNQLDSIQPDSNSTAKGFYSLPLLSSAQVAQREYENGTL